VNTNKAKGGPNAIKVQPKNSITVIVGISVDERQIPILQI
jgi:hypothetical protein